MSRPAKVKYHSDVDYSSEHMLFHSNKRSKYDIVSQGYDNSGEVSLPSHDSDIDDRVVRLKKNYHEFMNDSH